MPALDFHFQVNPTPKARPRLARFGTYTPAKTKQAEWELRMIVVDQLKRTPLPGKKPLECPCGAVIRLDFVRPKSAKKRTHHCVKPDLDNLIKMIMDAMNGFLWVDDAQVHTLQVSKHYADKPGIALKLIWDDENG